MASTLKQEHLTNRTTIDSQSTENFNSPNPITYLAYVYFLGCFNILLSIFGVISNISNVIIYKQLKVPDILAPTFLLLALTD